MKKNFFTLIIFICFGIIFVNAHNLWGASKRFLRNIQSHDAIYVIDDHGHEILEKHAEQLCVPASILKIITSLAAFHYLGLDYRYKTEFYRSQDAHLIVKGYGDPVLVSEELETIAYKIQKKYWRFSGIRLDATYFQPNIRVPGTTRTYNPYDALNAALCVNFNTVCFQRTRKGKLTKGEPHTPLIQFARDRIKHWIPDGRVNLFRNHHDIVLYAGHLMHYFLIKQGVDVPVNIEQAAVTPKDELLLTHMSGATVEEIVSMLLKFSNNFIANQLLLSIGAKVYGPPASLKKGAMAVKDFAKKQLGINHFFIVEGSGISRRNKISAKEMIKAVQAFAPYRHLLEKEDNLFFKTGTLNGVRTRAGFIQVNDTETFPFVIMMNRKNINNYRINHVIKSLNRYLASKNDKQL
jgi:D-alanyl-D-alanine carboxypeptidase/D-alanyl-D-alanine-endopeptidase (penicillin-binding protein 4)